MQIKTNYLVGVIVAVVIIAGGFFAYQYYAKPSLEGDTGSGKLSGPVVPANQAAHLITLTDQGFQPAELSIKQGETITFNTTDTKPFWPASNPHPVHWTYSEFDPRQPVMPQQTWSFTFNKVGVWKYHDHLAPYYTGTITVASSTSSTQ